MIKKLTKSVTMIFMALALVFMLGSNVRADEEDPPIPVGTERGRTDSITVYNITDTTAYVDWSNIGIAIAEYTNAYYGEHVSEDDLYNFTSTVEVRGNELLVTGNTRIGLTGLLDGTEYDVSISVEYSFDNKNNESVRTTYTCWEEFRTLYCEDDSIVLTENLGTVPIPRDENDIEIGDADDHDDENDDKDKVNPPKLPTAADTLPTTKTDSTTKTDGTTTTTNEVKSSDTSSEQVTLPTGLGIPTVATVAVSGSDLQVIASNIQSDYKGNFEWKIVDAK